MKTAYSIKQLFGVIAPLIVKTLPNIWLGLLDMTRPSKLNTENLDLCDGAV